MTLFQKLSPYIKWLIPPDDNGICNSLLSDIELQQLEAFAQSLPLLCENTGRLATLPLLGENLSGYRGRGFDFEENRAYQAGDEVRALNWHLYARSGELYTKVFNEERRSQMFLLLDRRATMRFGTRCQLKAELAARLCASYVYMSRQSSMAVGGMIMNQTLEWFEPATDSVLQHYFVHSIAAGCPPLDFDQKQPSLEEALQLLAQRLVPGCLVVLLSDFLDMDVSKNSSILHQLREQHRVHAIQILDPVEKHLPAGNSFLLEGNAAGSEPQRIHGNDRLQRQQYRMAVEQQQSALNAVFNDSDIPFHSFSTEDDVNHCIAEVSVDFSNS